MSVSF